MADLLTPADSWRSAKASPVGMPIKMTINADISDLAGCALIPAEPANPGKAFYDLIIIR
jgi:hypothetical protein